jgi:hypothetical protein
MSHQAGVVGHDEGLILTAFAFTPMKGLLLHAANYYGLRSGDGGNVGGPDDR